MSRRIAAVLISMAVFGLGNLGVEYADAQDNFLSASVRFGAVDIYLQSSEPLAAWQFELAESTGSMTVVGVENGESAAYAGTPYYDLEAVADDRADRIVVADYSLAGSAELPMGRTRIATVHVRLTGAGDPDFELDLIAAGDADGQAIAAAAELVFADGRTQ